MGLSPQQMWWLLNTSAGRRTLERFIPSSAIPIQTRRQMCAERGHDDSRGVCVRCGLRIEEVKRGR